MNNVHLSPKHFNSITYFTKANYLKYLPGDKSVALNWFKNGLDMKYDNTNAKIGTFYVDGKMGGGSTTCFICLRASNVTNNGDGGFWVGTDVDFVLQRQTMSRGVFTDCSDVRLGINIPNTKTPQIIDMAKLFHLNNCYVFSNQQSTSTNSTGYHSIGVPNNNYTKYPSYTNCTFKAYLRDVVNDLPEIQGGQVIQYAYGWADVLTADEIKIATDKGWTLA